MKHSASSSFWAAYDVLPENIRALADKSFALLKPGVTIEQARRELTRLMPRMGEMYPDIAPSMRLTDFLSQVRAGIVIHPMRDDVVGGFGNVALIAASAGVLLFAIASGAVLLARG